VRPQSRLIARDDGKIRTVRRSELDLQVDGNILLQQNSGHFTDGRAGRDSPVIIGGLPGWGPNTTVMSKAADTVRLAPRWLQGLAGLLLFPVPWLALAFAGYAVMPLFDDWWMLVAVPPAMLAALFVVRRASEWQLAFLLLILLVAYGAIYAWQGNQQVLVSQLSTRQSGIDGADRSGAAGGVPGNSADEERARQQEAQRQAAARRAMEEAERQAASRRAMEEAERQAAARRGMEEAERQAAARRAEEEAERQRQESVRAREAAARSMPQFPWPPP